MPLRPRKAKLAYRAGLSLCILMLAAWIVSAILPCHIAAAVRWGVIELDMIHGNFELCVLVGPPEVDGLIDWYGLMWGKAPISMDWPDVHFATDYYWLNLPLWIPFIPVALFTVSAYRRSRKPPSGHCRNCGYNLAGNTSGICAECGTVVVPC